MSKRLTDEEKAERANAKNRALAERYRETVCRGCHDNYYNWKQAGDGWNAPTDGNGCWNLYRISRGKCSAYRRDRS